MWTLISYIIATGATILGTFYTYKQYRHSQLKHRESFRKYVDEESISEKKVLTIIKTNQDKTDTIITGFQKKDAGLVSLVRTTQNDFHKVSILEGFVKNYRRTFTGEEVYDIVSLFTNDFHRSSAVSILSPRIQKPISEESFFRILSTFTNDFHKSSAKSKLLNF